MADDLLSNFAGLRLCYVLVLFHFLVKLLARLQTKTLNRNLLVVRALLENKEGFEVENWKTLNDPVKFD